MVVEDTSPMVCTAWTMYIRIIMMIASGWNSRLKCSGMGAEMIADSVTGVKSIRPPMMSATT